VKWDDGVRDMMNELVMKDLALEVGGEVKPTVTVSLRPKPKSDKCLMICDACRMIRDDGVGAKRFGLPRPVELLRLNGPMKFA